MAGEEVGCAVGLESGEVAVSACVGVQRLFLRGEGVEQGETGSAVNVLVVPLEQEFEGTVICAAASVRDSYPIQPKTAAVILSSTAANRTPIRSRCPA